MKKLLMFLFVGMFLMSSVSAFGFEEDNSNEFGFGEDSSSPKTFDFGDRNVADLWDTAEGLLDNVADIMGSWITNDLNWINSSQIPLEDGTAQGQMAFWDNSLKKWVHTETDEVFYNDSAKQLVLGNDGVSNNAPLLINSNNNAESAIMINAVGDTHVFKTRRSGVSSMELKDDFGRLQWIATPTILNSAFTLRTFVNINDDGCLFQLLESDGGTKFRLCTFGNGNVAIPTGKLIIGLLDHLPRATLDVRGNASISTDLFVGENLTVGERIIQDNYTIHPVKVNDNVIDSVFCLEMKSPSGQRQCKLVIQPGGSGQASILRRSLGIVNDDICNGLNATNMKCYADVGGFSWNIDFNTSTSGADVGIADDLEVIGEIWLRDAEGESKFFTRELSLRDELYENTLLNDATLSIVGGDLLINETKNETLVVNINRTETIFTTRSDSITLNTGTDLNPAVNHITYQNPSNPVLTIDTSDPSPAHSEVSVVYAGSNTNNIYLFENTISHNEKFIDQVYDTFGDLGGIYLSGLTPTFDSTTMDIATGEVRLRLNKISYTNALDSVADGFFYIDNTGAFIECNDNTCLSDYVDGSSISNNRYYSIVWGVVPVGNQQRLMVVLQGNPGSGREYNSKIAAEEDTLQKVNFFPSNTDFKLVFIPIARTIHRRTGNNDFATFPTTGELFQDLRGKATVSSGGVPSPPITDHNLLDNLAWNASGHEGTGNLNISAFNLTSVDYGFFSFIGSSISRITKGWFTDIEVENNVTLGSGAKFWSNTTCAFISSPDNSNVFEVCNT